MAFAAALRLVVSASRLPSSTSQKGPPLCLYSGSVTKETESRAAVATMSAQETVSGQTSSSCCLISSMTPNPRAEFKFGAAVCSPTKPGRSTSKLDPSQPCTM